MGRIKPFRFNAAVEQQRRSQLDNAGLDRFAPSGRALTYPTHLRGSGADPVFGGLVRYVRENNHMTVWFALTFTSGAGVVWLLDMPALFGTQAAIPMNIGSWTAKQASTGFYQEGWCQAEGLGLRGIYFNFRATAGLGALGQIGGAAPFAWASAGDTLCGFVTFEAADLYTP